MKKVLSLFVFIMSSLNLINAQKSTYLAIYPDSLRKNANAIIKENLIEIEIPSFDKMNIKKRRVITIFNEIGLKHMDASEYFDKSTSIKNIEAKIYNAFGTELKKIKRKDFKENSVSQGSTITDNRVLYLDYTPTEYPFTLVFESETSSSNTAFIPPWSPVEDYYISIVHSKLVFNYTNDVDLKYKEFNFDESILTKKETGHIEYQVDNIKAIKYEEMSPRIIKYKPYIMFGLNKFNLENVVGYANDWKSFGSWMDESLLKETDEIPQETIDKLKLLTKNANSSIEIAKIIYKFVQDKTRYVSIQLGIGGWRPMLAKDVDRLGYGDCKALTNYTRSLLKAFNIPSYYAVVYGDRNKRNIQEDFVSMQGNHVILGIPENDEIIWLECTSQTQAFGFQGDFTDDRNLLILKPEGGEIVKTKNFSEEDNLKTLRGSYQISENGNLSGNLKITSKGLQYDWEFDKERLNREDQIKRYKEEFDNINNLNLTEIKLDNDKNNIEFIEELELKAEGYAQNLNGKLMFAINAFNQNSYVPKKYKTREFPFEIQRGYTDVDEIEVMLPEGFEIEAKPNDFELDNEFGYYKIEFITNDSKKIIYKRKLVIKKGFYENLKYETYRKFRETIAKNDNSKIVIRKS